MDGAGHGDNTQMPADPLNADESEKNRVEVAEAADNLESMAITEEEPSNQPEVNENVADAAAPTPELPRLRSACQQLGCRL